MKSAPQVSPHLGRVFALATLAALLQLVPINLPGPDPLLLGTFVWMPLLLLLPQPWGLLSVVVPLGVTVHSLGHPLELVLGMLEALVLVVLMRWKPMSAPVADLYFWLFVGLPVSVAYQARIQSLPYVVVSFVAITQFISHIVAVATADLLIRYTTLGPWLGGLKQRAEARVRSMLLHLVLVLSLVPLIAIGVGLAGGLSSYVRDQDRAVLTETAARVSQQIDQFFEHHKAVLEHMAGVIGTGGADEAQLIEAARKAHPEFIVLIVTDDAGVVRHAISGDGTTVSGLRSIGQSETFRAVQSGRAPFISGIRREENVSAQPSVSICVPIFDPRGQVKGVVQGSIGLGYFDRFVSGNVLNRGHELLLVGRDGRVIVGDPSGSVPPGTRMVHRPEAALLAAPPGTRVEFERLNPAGQRIPCVGYAVRSEYGETTVIAQRPVTRAEESLAWIVWGFLTVVAVVVAAAAWAATAMRRRLSEPLEAFASAATHQAELRQMKPIPDTPTDAPYEVAIVYRAFNRLAAELNATYRELREHNVKLDQKVAERTRELEAARAVAESADRTKSEFLAMASHEIRTPLNVIIGLAGALQENARDPEARKQLDTIRGAGVRLLGFVNDVLDLSRIEAGRLELQLAPVELGALLREVEQMFRLGAEQQGLELRVETNAQCPLWFNGDAVRLLQILINLVGNALKFTPRGRVTLRVDEMGGGDEIQLQFGVIDTGPGIPPEFRATLFQPYVQVPGERAGGTGLGLPIARRLVNLLGGELALRSEPGQGSHFHFTIRVARVAPPPQSAERPVTRGTDATALRILAVDDNLANQEVLRLMLEPVCARLEIVGSAAEAMERLRRETFDVALIDLEMPVEDGYTVARALRVSAGGPNEHCLLVAISAYSQVDVWPRCAESGFDAFVGKPIVRAQLLELVSGARRGDG